MTIIHNTPPDIQLRGYYAGFVSRAIALIIDLVVLVTLQFVYVFIIRLIFNFLGFSSIREPLAQLNQGTTSVASPVVILITWTVAFLGSMFFFGLYVSVCWTLIDRTLGQAFIGLRVLRTNGEKLTFRRSIKRAVGLILSALPFFVGFLWVLVDDRRQGWHDKLADTIVVYDWDARLGKKVREWLARQQARATSSLPDDSLTPTEDISE